MNMVSSIQPRFINILNRNVKKELKFLLSYIEIYTPQ